MNTKRFCDKSGRELRAKIIIKSLSFIHIVVLPHACMCVCVCVCVNPFGTWLQVMVTGNAI